MLFEIILKLLWKLHHCQQLLSVASCSYYLLLTTVTSLLAAVTCSYSLLLTAAISLLAAATCSNKPFLVNNKVYHRLSLLMSSCAAADYVIWSTTWPAWRSSRRPAQRPPRWPPVGQLNGHLDGPPDGQLSACQTSSSTALVCSHPARRSYVHACCLEQ